MKGVTIEQLGISFDGEIVRRHDKQTDRTTISVTEEQARQMYGALGPVLEFFDSQHDDLEVDPGQLDGLIRSEPIKA